MFLPGTFLAVSLPSTSNYPNFDDQIFYDPYVLHQGSQFSDRLHEPDHVLHDLLQLDPS